MKKNILKIMILFSFVFVLFLESTNAEMFDQKTLEKNWKQTLLAGKIEDIIKKEGYPDYYGGMYISDDSEQLIIQIVRNNIPKKTSNYYNNYEKILTMSDTIKIEYVNNSYADLNKINDAIIEKYIIQKNQQSNWNANYIDVINNTVVIETTNNVTNIKKTIKNDLLNSVDLDNFGIVSIVQTKGKNINYATTLKAGQGISTSPGPCSMGFRAKVNGKTGIITAGHCTNGLNQNINGLGIVKKYKESGNVDAAFIETITTLSPSNTLIYSSGVTSKLNTVTSPPSLAVNTIIGKSGKSSKYTTGKITNLNYSGTFDGIAFTGLISTTAGSAPGDSGAPVFIPVNVSDGVTLVGILKGGNSSNANASMIFVKESLIRSSFNYTRY